MKLKKGLTESSGDFFYDLCEGYLKPENMCVNIEDAKRVADALATIQDFQESCENQIEGFIQ